jgi:hypothetical protein
VRAVELPRAPGSGMADVAKDYSTPALKTLRFQSTLTVNGQALNNPWRNRHLTVCYPTGGYEDTAASQ